MTNQIKDKAILEKKPRYFSIKEISPVIRFLTISDVLIISGFGLISPIFAVFVVDNIQGSSLEVVGIATTIYLLTKSLGQIPAAYLIDKIRGEKDDFWAMIIGSIVFSFIPVAYLFVNTPSDLYIIQFFYGLAVAFTFPSWLAIFTRHIDRNKEGAEWGVYQTLIDLGAAGTAATGGFLAAKFGFAPLFLIVAAISLIGSLFLVFIYKNMRVGHILVKKN